MPSPAIVGSSRVRCRRGQRPFPRPAPPNPPCASPHNGLSTSPAACAKVRPLVHRLIEAQQFGVGVCRVEHNPRYRSWGCSRGSQHAHLPVQPLVQGFEHVGALALIHPVFERDRDHQSVAGLKRLARQAGPSGWPRGERLLPPVTYQRWLPRSASRACSSARPASCWFHQTRPTRAVNPRQPKRSSKIGRCPSSPESTGA
jgi:hypothetical protein